MLHQAYKTGKPARAGLPCYALGLAYCRAYRNDKHVEGKITLGVLKHPARSREGALTCQHLKPLTTNRNDKKKIADSVE
jgi:hypothetical protein